MSPRKPGIRALRRVDATVAEMDQWRATLRDLPDVRDEKVHRARTSIRRSAYGNENVADVLVERMLEELDL